MQMHGVWGKAVGSPKKDSLGFPLFIQHKCDKAFCQLFSLTFVVRLRIE